MLSRNGSIILLPLNGVAVGGMNFRLKLNKIALVQLSTIFSYPKKSNLNAYFSFFPRSPTHMNSVEHIRQLPSIQSTYNLQQLKITEPLVMEGIKLLIAVVVLVFVLVPTYLLFKHKLPNKKKSEWEGEPF